MSESAPYTKWHTIFAAMLRELLTPLQIRVLDEFVITGEVDVILIQLLEGEQWTEEQRQYLPDGLRDSRATHLLLEFKYSQSLEEASFRQTIAYDMLYRQQQTNRDLPLEMIQTFIVSAKTPQAETLSKFGYQPTGQAGVYVSQTLFLQNIPLLLLNELSHEQHNAFVKLFASRRRAKLAAMETLRAWGLRQLKGKLFWLIKGLLNLWLQKGDELMEAITAETLIEDGKHIMELLGPLLTKEDILQLPTVQEVYRQALEQGIEKGIEQGIEKGIEQGIEKGIEKGIEQGIEKGIEKGIKQGAHEEILAVLLRTLPRLFGALQPELVAQIKQLTLPQLRQAMDLAFGVADLPEFEAQITAWLAAPKL